MIKMDFLTFNILIDFVTNLIDENKSRTNPNLLKYENQCHRTIKNNTVTAGKNYENLSQKKEKENLSL